MSSRKMMADETSGSTSRRSFLKIAGTGIALSSSAVSYARILGANDRVRVGVIGFSERFRDALLPSFQKHAAELNFELAAVSDIWRLRREEGQAHLKRVTGKEIASARNNAELLDRQDVDAVIVASSDFQHAQHGVAVRGKDAYVEKPWPTLCRMRRTSGGRFTKPKDCADRHAAAKCRELPARERVHRFRRIWRNRRRGNDLERESARAVAAAVASRKVEGRRHRLEAVAGQPAV
jgi:hypothetical protein